MPLQIATVVAISSLNAMHFSKSCMMIFLSLLYFFPRNSSNCPPVLHYCSSSSASHSLKYVYAGMGEWSSIICPHSWDSFKEIIYCTKSKLNWLNVLKIPHWMFYILSTSKIPRKDSWHELCVDWTIENYMTNAANPHWLVLLVFYSLCLYLLRPNYSASGCFHTVACLSQQISAFD